MCRWFESYTGCHIDLGMSKTAQHIGQWPNLVRLFIWDEEIECSNHFCPAISERGQVVRHHTFNVGISRVRISPLRPSNPISLSDRTLRYGRRETGSIPVWDIIIRYNTKVKNTKKFCAYSTL